MVTTFEDLLANADLAARQGDWQAALAALEQAARLEPEHTGVLTGLGTCLIQLGQPAEALPRFQQAARLEPQAPEAHNNLGVACALLGRLDEAEQAYRQAVALAPEHWQAWKNLALIALRQERYEDGVPILANLARQTPDDAEVLVLLGQCYEAGEDAESARLLYGRVLELDNEAAAQAARQGLQRLPAPQTAAQTPDPSRIARPEHAKKLAALKSLKPAGRAPAPAPAGTAAFFGPLEQNGATETRLGAPARALLAAGWQVKTALQLEGGDMEAFDTFIFANPQLNPQLALAVEACAQAGKRVIIDIDRDFHHLPADHPGYAAYGPGSPKTLRLLETLLGKASVATFPGRALEQFYRRFARQTAVIPYAWSRSGPGGSESMWEKAFPRRNTGRLAGLQIGFVGNHTHFKDTAALKAALKRIFDETPGLLLLIGGDWGLYEAFPGISEARKTFLPAGSLEDYPYLLASYDLLLFPYREMPYNHVRSDQALMEAGIRRIPWLASPLPSFQEWGAGGLLVEKQGDWYSSLKRLVSDAALRASLGEAGRRKAESREISTLVNAWTAVF